MIGGNFLQVAISRQLGAAELGLYYLATQIAFLAYEVASEVVGSVAFPLYARLQNNLEQAVVTFRAVFTSMAALLYPLCALIIVLAPTLVEEVLGPQWNGTAPIIQVLSLAAVLGLLADSTAPIFQGLGQPNRITVVEFVQSSILIASVWTLAGNFGVVGAAAAWIPAYLAAQIVSAYFLVKLLAQPFSGVGKPLVIITLISIISAILAYIIDNFVSGLAGFIIAAVTSAVITLGLMIAAEKWFNLALFTKIAMFFPQINRLLGFFSTKIKMTSA
jgi:O-antigen/teichoic acid export membrane protein